MSDELIDVQPICDDELPVAVRLPKELVGKWAHIFRPQAKSARAIIEA